MNKIEMKQLILFSALLIYLTAFTWAQTPTIQGLKYMKSEKSLEKAMADPEWQALNVEYDSVYESTKLELYAPLP